MTSRPPPARPSTVRMQKTKQPSSGARRPAGKPSGGPAWRRWALGGWLMLALWFGVEAARLPDVGALRTQNPRTTALMAQRAEEALEAGTKPRVRQAWVPLGAVAPHAVDAVLCSEDARFYRHEGVDWTEVENAFEQSVREARLGRGASTLTQQLAKNLYLSTDRSLLRKGKELLLARQLESHLSKQRILALYLNVVEWGEGVYGIEAAAREHFGVSARSLSVAQGAMLAAMLPAPRRWLPAQRPETLRTRAGVIIGRLEREGRISAAQAREAQAELSRFFGGPAAPGLVADAS
ncbi:monofunctional biosynthetic peptidoglycan transglycosylase [Corallococcus exiguus]|uniref:monofunctional biosynthetic peptidoglycan transglycosylase n=1 Tax=Corallococcus TaxID=83461 RepID=UPI000EE3402D|nr:MULTISPECIES: monofunctional biosynthetic peptidoglycan transglycosylase [Corallococcus]NNC03856.1 monofunctional biosynthetic peptidoglycan transglycosylase [Corallococcus exiguus]NPC46318.1 monofunctional biosynthetic peptidoglycan transglycosylase [Corallococcus exiguus]RKH78899.1 monofunctional biosynthetic peptidoglycan transglycosylase [Corallococcus sp. AB032C]